MIKTLFLILLFVSRAYADEIDVAFKGKDFHKVTEIYRLNQRKDFSYRNLVLISYSLRQLGFFRQDIKLNIRLLKKDFLPVHKKLLMDIKEGSTPDSGKISKKLKVLYWNILNDYGEIIKGYAKASKLLEKDQQHFNSFSKILSELEFREGKVDKKNEEIIGHIQHLANKEYKWSSSWFVSYVSWQQEAGIEKNTGEKAGLILTNKGFCTGGETGVENYLFHFSLDGCLLFGSGGVSRQGTSTIRKYQQSNIPAYGFKTSPGISMIVSSSRSRIGIKIPIIYSIQKLTAPTSDYSMKEDSPLSVITSLYSRWQFSDWYFQTEFGKYVAKESTFWGFGIGKNF